MQNDMKNKTVQDGAVVTALGAALGAFSLYSFFHSPIKAEWVMSPYLFPMLIACFAFGLGLCLLLEGKRQVKQGGESDTPRAEKKPAQTGKAAAVVAMSLGYYILIKLITFVPATIVFVFALMWFMGERRKPIILFLPIVATAAIYAVFALGLNVRLP